MATTVRPRRTRGAVRDGGVVVANPGGVTWMIDSAAAFAAHGELGAYVNPVAVGPADLERLRRLPGGYGEKAASVLGRRAVPDEVAGDLQRVGTLLELANTMLLRTPQLPMKVRRGLFRPRMERFDLGVSRMLTPRTRAVVGYQGSALTTLRRARELGVHAVLDYPIAHFETIERIIEEEARLTPRFAPTFQGYPDWLRQRYADEIATADTIVMLSRYHQDTFEEAGVDPSRMFIAPLGVDLDVFTPAPEQPDGPFRVAFCGQITQRKGISYLIEGFHRAELGPDAELLFIGLPIGPTDAWIDEPGVRFVPPMARNSLPEVLRTCHVITLPSLIEGFGATALEGMACGLPSIVTPHTFADDVVEEGVDGFIVPIRDPDAIAERLRALRDDPALQARMGAAARRKAEQFPWSRYREALRDGVIARSGD
jgi:glycosyltransferase involved in cell wall biosynthesis